MHFKNLAWSCSIEYYQAVPVVAAVEGRVSWGFGDQPCIFGYEIF